MVSLQDFRSVPYAGNVSVCEKGGRLCTLPVTEVGVSRFGGADNLVSFFLILIRHQASNTCFCFSAVGVSRNINKS